jgi:hypothetical protein
MTAQKKSVGEHVTEKAIISAIVMLVGGGSGVGSSMLTKSEVNKNQIESIVDARLAEKLQSMKTDIALHEQRLNVIDKERNDFSIHVMFYQMNKLTKLLQEDKK